MDAIKDVKLKLKSSKKIDDVDQPLSENYIKIIIIKRMEKMFNNVWYHLYRVLDDIETRRKYVTTEKIAAERNLLLQYAKKAAELWRKRSLIPDLLTSDELGDEKEMVKNIEQEIQALRQNIEFLDNVDINARSKEIIDAYQSKTASKYKEVVLSYFGIQDTVSSPSRKPESHTSQENLVPSRNSNIDSVMVNKHMSNKTNPGVVYAASKHTQKINVKTRNVAKFGETVHLEDIKAPPLFGDEIVTISNYLAEKEPEIPLKKVFKQKRNSKPAYRKIHSEVQTPLTNHAKQQITLSKEQIDNLNKRSEDLHNSVAKVNKCIFGTIRSDKLKRASNAKTATPLRVRQQEHPEFEKRRNHYARSISPQKTYEIPKEPKSDQILKIDNILHACTKEQKLTQRVFRRTKTAGIRLRKSLSKMENKLENSKSLISKQSMNNYAKFISQHKFMFIYGKEGLGRFLNFDGQDLIKMSDQMTKIRPEYKFLTPRLGDILIKEPIYL